MKNKIYGLESRYYDFLYSFIDYKKQVDYIHTIITQYQKQKNNNLLEVACGTGNHTQFLKSKYDVIGFDINLEMIKRARLKNKDIEFFRADMTNFSIKKSFGSIVCLASSIGYLKNYSNLKKALKNFFEHLEPGGVLVIEPWNFNHQPGKNQNISMLTYNSPDLKLVRGGVINKKGIVSICEDTFLIVEKGRPVKVFNDTNELAQFDDEKVLKMMKEIGFDVHLEKTNELYSGKIYVGVKNNM